MNGHTINYEHLAKEALRSVVKNVLERVAREGLPGDHHFYISFHTTAPGVKISNRISAQYPKEMTIVLQHQFWDLKVEEEHFEVRLSFSNIPELLIIPYTAVKVFFDPSVPYGLQFDHSARPEAVEDKSSFLDETWNIQPENNDQNIEGLTPAGVRAHEGADLNISNLETPDNKTATDTGEDPTSSENDPGKTENPANQDEVDDKDSAEIVSLDAFRNKNN